MVDMISKLVRRQSQALRAQVRLEGFRADSASARRAQGRLSLCRGGLLGLELQQTCTALSWELIVEAQSSTCGRGSGSGHSSQRPFLFLFCLSLEG